MGNIGSGAGSSYPTALDTQTTVEVNSPSAGMTKARAEVANDVISAVLALETELGTDPAGTLSDVKTFLQTEHNTNGTHNYPVTTTNTVTLTNKKISKRITSITSSATPTINTDNCDCVTITAQAENITSMTTNLSGTPTNKQPLIIDITGTDTRTITWGTGFESSTVLLPTTTDGTNTLSCGFFWNSVTSKWRIAARA